MQYHRTPLFSIALLLCTLLVSPAAFGETGGETTSRADAVDRFTRDFVWAEDTRIVGVNQYGQAVSSSQHTNFYQGRHKRPLAGLEFYKTVGRDDLAGEYRSRRARRRGLIWSGVGAQVVGLGLMVGGIISMTDYDNMYDDGPLIIFGAGLGLTLVGMIPMMIGMFTNPHPIQPHEAREIIEDYNLQLMRDLNLDREDLPQEDEDTPGMDSLRVNLFFSGDGDRGLALSFDF